MKHLQTCILARLVLLSLPLAAAAGLFGCAARRPEAGTIVPLAAPSFVRQWRTMVPAEKDAVTELHLRGERLFVYTRDHRVIILGAGEGESQFIDQVVAPTAALRAPVVLDAHIVYPSDESLVIYDQLGRRQEAVALPRRIRSEAIGDGSQIFLGLDYSDFGRLAAVNIGVAFDKIRWELLMRGALSSRPALDEENVYAADEHGQVVAVSRTNRQPVWAIEGNVYKTGGAVRADLVVDESNVYVASTDSKLHVLDRASGKLRWQYFAGRPLTQAPVVTRRGVYQPLGGRGLAALDRGTGAFNRSPLWINKQARKFLSEDDQHVYVLLEDQRLAALDRGTGAIRFASRRSDLAVFAPNPQDSTIYAARRDGEVLAIRPALQPGGVGELVLLPQRQELARVNP